MDDSSYEHDYYLDLQTGDILFVLDYTDDEESKKLGRISKKRLVNTN